jgi:hypothetical protein
MRLPKPWLPIFMFAAACGDDGKPAGAIDAPKQIDAPGVDLTSKEGGEVRLEYMTFTSTAAQQTRARATAFFYDGADGNGFHPFPNVPGCTDYTPNPPVRWPFVREASDQFLDVGTVTIEGGPQPLTVAPITPAKGSCSVTTATKCFQNSECPATETCMGATGNRDNLNRLYTGHWAFSGQAPGPNLNNMGPAFITGDATYTVKFGGSANFPATEFKDIIYVPGLWTPVSPAIDENPVLKADTPLTITYTTPANSNKPADHSINTLVFFVGAIDPPVVACIEEGTDGSITIPADMINLIRASAPTGGKFIRQHASHVVRELTDGTTHTNKRIDFIGIWCYNYTFTVAP